MFRPAEEPQHPGPSIRRRDRPIHPRRAEDKRYHLPPRAVSSRCADRTPVLRTFHIGDLVFQAEPSCGIGMGECEGRGCR